jgi:hypothetical protein
VADQDGATTLALGLTDRPYPLRAEGFYRIFDDTDVIERGIHPLATVRLGGRTPRPMVW